MMRSGTRYLFPLMNTSSTATLSCVDDGSISRISMFPLLTCPGRTTSITVRFCLGIRCLIRFIPSQTRKFVNVAAKTYKCMVYMVWTHPFPVQRGHREQRRVETIKVPVKWAEITGDYAPPLL